MVIVIIIIIIITNYYYYDLHTCIYTYMLVLGDAWVPCLHGIPTHLCTTSFNMCVHVCARLDTRVGA